VADKIGYLLKRPVGPPPHEVRRSYASFGYQAQSWKKPRRVMAKVEWHPGELYPRVGFIVTNLARPAARVVVFYNQRGTAERWIKEGIGAIKWTRLSCRTFAANAVRLRLHALAYNLGNFMRTLAIPKAAEPWSLTILREKLRSARRSSAMAATSPSRWPRSRCHDRCSSKSCRRSPGCGHRPCRHEERGDQMRKTTTATVRLEAGEAARCSASAQSTDWLDFCSACGARFTVARDGRSGDPWHHNHAESGECRLKLISRTGG
jgi:hypothetical protein